ncbi:MAG: TolC family protein [Chitinophagales bacterium]|nr:TolC family protein [Chitinophagales bacterium]
MFAIFFIVLSATSSSAQKTWTLEQSAAYAIEHNISIRQSQSNEKLSAFTLNQAKLNLLPNLSGSVGYYFNFGKTIDPTTSLFVNQNTQTNTLQLSASWPIFNGLQKLNLIKENEFGLLASRANTQATEQNILLSVAGAFLDIVYAKENLINSNDQLSLSQQQLTRSRILIETGSAAPGSIYNIEAQVAQDELNRVNAENQLALAKLSLAQLMNLSDPVVDVMVPDINMSNELLVDLNKNGDSIYQIALKKQAVIRSSEFALMSSEKALAAIKGAQYPSLSLFGSISTNYSNAYQQLISFDTVSGGISQIGFVESTGEAVVSPELNFVPRLGDVPYYDQLTDNFGQTFGLSLDIPIFNNWNTRTNISRSKINVVNAQYNLQSAKLQLQKDVQIAYQDAVGSKNSYEALLKSVASLQRAFEDAQKRYNLGSINSFDYTTAKSNLSKAQSDLLQSKYRYIFNLKVLDVYQGKPLTLQ